MGINQCDGCMSGADVKTGHWGGLLHIDRLGKPFMACVAEMYKDKPAVEVSTETEDGKVHD